MRFILAALVCSVSFLAASAADKDKPEPQKLFNGEDLTGWTFFLDDDKAKAEDVWEIKDGVLICKGNPVGYIKTEEVYDNYVLTLEWRFDPDKGAGNSGVLLGLVGEDKVWPKSIEAQLHSENAGDFWNIGEVKMKVAADRTEGRRTKKMKKSNEKPLGEWNHYEITVNEGKITLKVNGEVQNIATECDRTPGQIGLQSEGAEIHFRNIELTPIE